MNLLCIDLDNTLIDSDKPHILAYNKAFKKHKLKKISAKKIKKLFGLVGSEIVKKLFPKLSEKEINEIVNSHDYFLNKETKKHLKPFKGVKLTLKKLKEKYKLAVISNCRHKEILIILKTVKINPKIFSAIIGNDDVNNPKPFPDEILKAQKLLHLKAKFMIGDSIYDIKAGKKAKVKTIAVLTGNHSKIELKKEQPDYLLNNFKDILRIL